MRYSISERSQIPLNLEVLPFLAIHNNQPLCHSVVCGELKQFVFLVMVFLSSEGPNAWEGILACWGMEGPRLC